MKRARERGARERGARSHARAHVHLTHLSCQRRCDQRTGNIPGIAVPPSLPPVIPEGGPYLEPRSSKRKPGVVHEPERCRVDTVIQVINISGKRIELSRPQLSSSTGSIGEGRTVGTHANGGALY